MRLGERDRAPYEIESEKEDAPAHPEPAPMRHEPRRDTILKAPIRLAVPGAVARGHRRVLPRRVLTRLPRSAHGRAVRAPLPWNNRSPR